MSKILVAYATLDGTAELLAQLVARQLAPRFPTEVALADEVVSLRGYTSVVLGSELWQADWLLGAREFLDSFQDALRERPVWLYSSVATSHQGLPYPTALASLIDYVRPQGVMLFSQPYAVAEALAWSRAIATQLAALTDSGAVSPV